MNHKYPLFKISIAYLTGLISGAIFFPDSSLLIITTSTSIIAVAGVYYYRQNCSNSVNNTQIVKILDITVVVSIYLLAQLNLNLSGYHDKITKITSIPSGKIKSTELIVIDVLNINDSEVSMDVLNIHYNENQRLKIRNFKEEVSIGDTLYGICYSFPIKKDSKNNAFARNLSLNKIYSVCYMYSGSFELHRLSKDYSLDIVEKLKSKFIHIVKKAVKDKERASVIIALTTGYKKDMDIGTKSAFSKSGSMHLMAVSGLHIGFIHIFLSFSLIWLGNIRVMKAARGVIILSFIWFYALFTGMQESVLRASIMISCMEISKILGRKSFGINNLAFAFLVICILNPESFFKAGFRLSFVATLSILVFNPILLRFQQDPGLITGYLWRNLSLSISCQLGTLPLSIIYFGFVPTYFLLSNLIAIPLSAIVIIVTALLLVLDGTFICPLVSTILNYASSLLVWVVKSIESLPFSVITLR